MSSILEGVPIRDKTEFPILVRCQSVVVKIYRQKAENTASGCIYVVAWVGPNGREKINRADLKEARELAESKASALAAGLAEKDHWSRADALELAQAREMALEIGHPISVCLQELAAARRIVGPNVVQACEAFAARRTGVLNRVTVDKGVELFLAAKVAEGRSLRTYESKLKGVKETFKGQMLDTVTVGQWTKFLERYEDGVTRNDIRKKCMTFCRWARDQGHLAREAVPEVELTKRAREAEHTIGILTPEQLPTLLEGVYKRYPQYLAPLVLGCLCGMRQDEIQGKRERRHLRQTWDHIYLDRGYLTVDAAKENTPSNRVVHLQPAATAWLSLVSQKTGYVGVAQCMEKLRWVVRNVLKLEIPENCFRHSFITYFIAMTGDKPRCATEAGNSVEIIDERYRVPQPKERGQAWFAVLPPADFKRVDLPTLPVRAAAGKDQPAPDRTGSPEH